VNDAVTSVFIASLKIAGFYGLYTYITHTLLGSNLAFVPAVIASICVITLKSYLTALAIAGGVYYRGIEGALIGPIILCCLLVGIRMYNETMSTTLSSKSHHLLISNIRRRFDRSFTLQPVITR